MEQELSGVTPTTHITQPPASPTAPAKVKVTRIEPIKGWISLGLDELWEYRQLLVFLIWRDVKVRYKQTIIGAAWAILQPLFTMIIFTFIFGRMAQMSSNGVPYPIFSYAALVPFYFFSNALTQGSNSLLTNTNMVKKIYFPRLIVPLSAVLAGLVDFVLAFSILIVMMIYYGIAPTVNVLWLPAFLLLAWASAQGMALWFAALNAQFRDVRYIVPFLSQAFLFLTPVGYPFSEVPQNLQLLTAMNPMTGVVEGFRWALMGAGEVYGSMMAISSVVGVVLLISGAYYFRRMEKKLADVL